jgi:chaperonin GroEL (HSP60 family)
MLTSMSIVREKEIAINVKPDDSATLKRIATTALASKVVRESSETLADITVEAILRVAMKEENVRILTILTHAEFVAPDLIRGGL